MTIKCRTGTEKCDSNQLDTELINTLVVISVVSKRLEEIQMGKVSELSQLIEELNRCGNTFIGISEDLKNLFSGSEEAEETEPKTKVAKETPAKAPKKEKTLSLEDVRAVMADKSRKGYTAEVKALLTKRGINKLSDVDAKDYAALLAEVEVIGDAG